MGLPAGLGIRTFVFIDCETTGLEPWSKITELCMVAIHSDHLLATKENELPRTLNKLTLCFNPLKVITPIVSELTGLSNDLLEHAAPFSEKTVEMLQQFISLLPQPACLVAHNGNKFDYPIMRNHINKFQNAQSLNGLLSVDSLQLFRHLHDVEVKEIKLKEEELFKSTPSELLDDDWDFAISQKLDELDSSADAEFLQKTLLVKKINETTPKKRMEEQGAISDNGDVSSPKSPTKSPTRKKLEFGKKRPSFKLVDVFERLTGIPAMKSHEAEDDVIMMAKCAAVLGQKFVSVANQMALPFSTPS